MAGLLDNVPEYLFALAFLTKTQLKTMPLGLYAFFGEDTAVKEGDEVRRSETVASVPVGEELTGRIVDALGNAIDGNAPISTSQDRIFNPFFSAHLIT